MSRHAERNGDALAGIVATLLSLAAIATAADALPPARRIALLAVLRHAAAVAFAFAAGIHAPVGRRPEPAAWPVSASGDDDAAELAATLHVLAWALAVHARRAWPAATGPGGRNAQRPGGSAADVVFAHALGPSGRRLRLDTS